MKEDILEQLVEDWLQSRGYFTRHNLKFKPRSDHAEFAMQQDCVPSDIDVIGIHPLREGADRVVVVGCKSWQDGFDARAMLHAIKTGRKVAGREAWRGFRELVRPKWSEAFMSAVEKAAGTRRFQYFTAVTFLRGDKDVWVNDPEFRNAIGGNSVGIVTLAEMAIDVANSLTTTVAGSSFGRTLQLLKASGVLPAR
jgi:hypothetical protein